MRSVFSLRALRILGLAAVVIAAVPGCGDKGVKKVTVKGTVTYKGEKVTSGLLKWSGPAYTVAQIQEDGSFIMTDVIPGEVKVGVMESPSGSGSSDPNAKSAPGPKRSPASALPQKLREPDTSGVTVTITPDTKELNVDLG